MKTKIIAASLALAFSASAAADTFGRYDNRLDGATGPTASNPFYGDSKYQGKISGSYFYNGWGNYTLTQLSNGNWSELDGTIRTQDYVDNVLDMFEDRGYAMDKDQYTRKIVADDFSFTQVADNKWHNDQNGSDVFGNDEYMFQLLREGRGVRGVNFLGADVTDAGTGSKLFFGGIVNGPLVNGAPVWTLTETSEGTWLDSNGSIVDDSYAKMAASHSNYGSSSSSFTGKKFRGGVVNGEIINGAPAWTITETSEGVWLDSNGVVGDNAYAEARVNNPGFRVSSHSYGDVASGHGAYTTGNYWIANGRHDYRNFQYAVNDMHADGWYGQGTTILFNRARFNNSTVSFFEATNELLHIAPAAKVIVTGDSSDASRNTNSLYTVLKSYTAAELATIEASTGDERAAYIAGSVVDPDGGLHKDMLSIGHHTTSTISSAAAGYDGACGCTLRRDASMEIAGGTSLLWSKFDKLSGAQLGSLIKHTTTDGNFDLRRAMTPAESLR